MDLNIQIGKRLRQLRNIAELTQEELAEKANLSLNFIAMVETGKRTPTIGTLHTISTALNCTMADFFNTTPPSPKNTTDKSLKLAPKEIALLLKANKLLGKRLTKLQ